VVDQRLEVVARALAVGGIEDQPLEPGFLEIVVERGIVLQIDFPAAAADVVELRLGEEEMPVLDHMLHLPD
jgi:hypothetical protein